MDSLTSNFPKDTDISNICTLYVNSSLDKMYNSDTESDFHVPINVDWERKGLNKIACTSLSVPISNYIVPRNTQLTLSVSSDRPDGTSGPIANNKVITLTGGMITSVVDLVKSLNTQLGAGFENFFKYDYDGNHPKNADPAISAINAPIGEGFITGRIYSDLAFRVTNTTKNDTWNMVAPILGLRPTTDVQSSIKIGTKFAMPLVSDIIPYSIIYLACDECSNGVLSSSGTSILASIFFNNEANFSYIRQDFALQANAKWLTRKTNNLHLYFLDENKKKIDNFNGIGAFATIALFHDSSEPVLK